MYKFIPLCHLQGENFSPKLAEEKTETIFYDKNEIGDPARYGRNKNQPLTYGSASIETPETIKKLAYGGLEWLVDLLSQNIDIYKKCGAEDIYVDLGVFYTEQCNLAFDPTLLMKIAKLNISFCISCYQYDNLDDL